MNADPCPVRTQTGEALKAARHFSAAMRRLRRAMRRCRTCLSRQDCPALANFNLHLQQALAQAAEVWAVETGGEVE